MGQVKTHALTAYTLVQGLIYMGTVLKDTSAGRTVRPVEELRVGLHDWLHNAFFDPHDLTDF